MAMQWQEGWQRAAMLWFAAAVANKCLLLHAAPSSEVSMQQLHGSAALGAAPDFSSSHLTLSSSPFPANDCMQHIFCAVVGASHFTTAASSVTCNRFRREPFAAPAAAWRQLHSRSRALVHVGARAQR